MERVGGDRAVIGLGLERGRHHDREPGRLGVVAERAERLEPLDRVRPFRPRRVETLAGFGDRDLRLRGGLILGHLRVLRTPCPNRRPVAAVAVAGVGEAEQHIVEREPRIAEDRRGEDVAALDRQFVMEPGAERLAARSDRLGRQVGGATRRRRRRQRPIVTRQADRRFAVVGRVERHLAVAAERQKHTDLALDLVGQFGRLVVDRLIFLAQPIRFRIERGIGVVIDTLVLHIALDDLHALLDLVAARLFLVRQRRCRQRHAVEVGRDAVEAGRGDGAHPCDAQFLAEPLGLGLHQRGSERLREFRVGPAVTVLAEQFALDAAARGDIGIGTDQDRDRIRRLHRVVGDRATDLVGVDVGRVTILLEHALLLGLVGRRAVGLGHLVGDLARGQGFEDRFGKIGEAQPSLDEAAGLAKPFGDRVDVTVGLEEVLERDAFLGDGHLLALEILGQRHLAQVRLVAGDDLDRHVIVGGNDLAGFGQHHRTEIAAIAGDYLEHALRAGGGHQQVLHDAASADAGGHRLDILGRGGAHVLLGTLQLREFDGLGHLSSP